MIFIFDLDHTLMNSGKFKDGLPKIFGLSKGAWRNSVKKHFAKELDLYSPLKHAEMCYESGEINKKQLFILEKRLRLLASNASRYLFPDVERLLGYLCQENNYLILLSHGDKKWQRLKIKELPIKKYFDKVIITDKSKIKAINFLKRKSDDIVIVNDNARENREMINFLRRGRAILIKSIHSQEIKHNHKIYSFKQATKIIMNKF